MLSGNLSLATQAEAAFAISQRERMEVTLQQLQQQLQTSETSRSALSDQLSASRAESITPDSQATISAATENLAHNLQSAVAMASAPLPDREHAASTLHEQHQSSQPSAPLLEPGQPVDVARSRQRDDIERAAADPPRRLSTPAGNTAPDRKQVRAAAPLHLLQMLSQCTGPSNLVPYRLDLPMIQVFLHSVPEKPEEKGLRHALSQGGQTPSNK